MTKWRNLRATLLPNNAHNILSPCPETVNTYLDDRYRPDSSSSEVVAILDRELGEANSELGDSKRSLLKSADATLETVLIDNEALRSAFPCFVLSC